MRTGPLEANLVCMFGNDWLDRAFSGTTLASRVVAEKRIVEASDREVPEHRVSAALSGAVNSWLVGRRWVPSLLAASFVLCLGGTTPVIAGPLAYNCEVKDAVTVDYETGRLKTRTLTNVGHRFQVSRETGRIKTVEIGPPHPFETIDVYGSFFADAVPEIIRKGSDTSNFELLVRRNYGALFLRVVESQDGEVKPFTMINWHSDVSMGTCR